MSITNPSPVRSVESLRAALSEAQAAVERLELELKAAEQDAATAAVLAMVDGPIPDASEVSFPAQPVPEFICHRGPSSISRPVFEMDGGLDRGGCFVKICGSGSESGVEWMVFTVGRVGEVPLSEFVRTFVSWRDAVSWARRMHAKWSSSSSSLAAAA